MMPGCHIIAYADCYRCPFKLEHPQCGLACVEAGRAQLKHASSGAVAAFVVEPMQGTSGNIVPPDDFLPAVAELAKQCGALLIVDEMITGMGRTGKLWGSHHSGVRADIVTLGKQFGGGYPISAVMAREEISRARPWSNPSGSSSSYGGNPLACAAAATAIRIIKDEGLVENSAAVGKYFLERLLPMQEKYPFVGEVRGRGLFIGMELVRDKITKEPLDRKTTEALFRENLKRGLLTMSYASSFRIQPALTIDTGTIDEVVSILTETFDWLSKSNLWK
jgi:4-aminobutyrate aminotransferase-like enzyme